MFLKCLDIYGFKSFADKTHIDFADGITTLLGPNGCGKSNIVDSIKWVLGEQGTKTLRATKRDDVIFNGNEKRKPMPFAEVALTIDNSNGLLDHPASEIEIKRRIFRATGENEYYLNKERCLRKDIKNLLLDTGVGKSAYSVLEQGKIDQIISMSPEERRYIFEEAAGISKYKQQCTEANNKILKTEENITIVENTVSQVRRTYNRTKDQAEKARKYRELNKRGFELEVELSVAKIKTFRSVQEMRRQNIEKMKKETEEIEKRLETFDDEIKVEMESFRGKNEEIGKLRIKSTELSGEINNYSTKIEFLSERISDYSIRERSFRERSESLKANLKIMKEQFESLDMKIDDANERLDEIKGQIDKANSMIEGINRSIEENSAEIERREDENNRLSEEMLLLSDELKSVIEELIKQVDENSSSQYSKERSDKSEKELKENIDSLVAFIKMRLDSLKNIKADSVPKAKEEEDYSRILKDLERIRSSFDSFKDSIPPLVDLLLSPEGLMAKKREIEEKEKTSRKKSEENRLFISAAKEKIERLRSDFSSMRDTLSDFNVQKAQIEADISRHEEMKDSIYKNINEREYEVNDNIEQAELVRKNIESANDELKEADFNKKKAEDELRDVNRRADELSSTLSEQSAKIQSMRNEKDEISAKIDSNKQDVIREELYINNANDSIKDVYETFFRTFNRNLNEFSDYFNMDLELTLIENELREVNKAKESAGNINYLAEDEFNDAKASLDFYTKQLDDLYKAKSDLEKVLHEIEDTSKDLFLKTYKEISQNFQIMFNRLFGGGMAKVSLQNEEEVLTTGIDIFAQPPGKKLTSMSLLSGGERSMTAVALLFATYKVKPSPFCILDEIDAALDDRNIGYFISVLEDFGKESQFIIITHNKHTVTAGDTMLGVTQQEAGVSMTVSYKIKSIEGKPVITDEDDNEIGDID